MQIKFSVLAALAFLAGTNAAYTCNVKCTVTKYELSLGSGKEELSCIVDRNDGFVSYPRGAAYGNFPSVCNNDYCITVRWPDCRYLDLSVNGKVYYGKGSCSSRTEYPQDGVIKHIKESSVYGIGCQY